MVLEKIFNGEFKKFTEIDKLERVFEVEKDDIYRELLRISYTGDLRTYLKAENKGKVENILKGNYKALDKIYKPLLNELFQVSKNRVTVAALEFDQTCWENWPSGLKHQSIY